MGDGPRDTEGVGDPPALPPQVAPAIGPVLEVAFLAYLLQLRLTSHQEEPVVSTSVRIVRNVEKDWTVELLDSYGRVEDTSGLTAATMDLRKAASSATSVLARTMAAGGITLVEKGVLRVAGVASGEWASIPAGSYVGRFVLTIGGQPVPTTSFRVDVEERIAA